MLTLLSLATISCASRSGLVDSQGGVGIFTRSVGAGPHIVVIHGGPGMDHESLAADLAPLAQRHLLIYYDQRGGGRSTLPDDPSLLTIDHHVADLEAIRKHYGLEKLTILAHSFGPAIAALYALEHPARVDRMIFLGPIPPRKGTFFEDYGRNLEARLSPEDARRADELAKRMNDGVDVVASCREYWRIETPPRLAKGVALAVVKSDLCAASAEAIQHGMSKTNPATFGSLGEWDWRERLKTVRAPVLIIYGVEDAIPLEQVREWTALPNSRLLELEGAGHFPHAEKPDIVFPASEEFLRERRVE